MTQSAPEEKGNTVLSSAMNRQVHGFFNQPRRQVGFLLGTN
jgi:hypothetical protein